MDKLTFAMVCRCNMNRSMEAHKVLSQNSFKVESYGTGRHCKLPGPTPDEPKVFAFGTPYKQIMSELQSEDSSLYTQNGVLEMLERNAGIKSHPQRWQEQTKRFDIVVTFEKEVFNDVLDDLQHRAESSDSSEPVHVINMEVRDKPKEAEIAATSALHLSQLLAGSEDIEDEIESLLKEFEARSGYEILHTLVFA